MGKGFNLAIKIVKDINKANIRAIKEQERELKAEERRFSQQLKLEEREDKRLEKEYGQMLKSNERDKIKNDKDQIKLKKEELKKALVNEKIIFENRILMRTNMRIETVRTILK